MLVRPRGAEAGDSEDRDSGRSDRLVLTVVFGAFADRAVVWEIGTLLQSTALSWSNRFFWFYLTVILSLAVDHCCDLVGRVVDGVVDAAACGRGCRFSRG